LPLSGLTAKCDGSDDELRPVVRIGAERKFLVGGSDDYPSGHDPAHSLKHGLVQVIYSQRQGHVSSGEQRSLPL
jgi:hypothetical protein